MSLASVFGALSNHERLAILAVLREWHDEQPRPSITAIAEAVGLSRFSASRHLRILTEAGFLSVEREGLSLLHHLGEFGFEAIEDWLCDFILIDQAVLQYSR